MFRKLFAAGSLYLLATLAPTLTLLAITPAVTRLLGAASYGDVAVAVTIYQLTSVAAALGLPLAITRHAILEKGGYSAAAGIVLIGACFATILAGFSAVCVPFWGNALFPSVDTPVLALSVIAGAGLAIVTMSQALFRASEQVGIYVALALAAAAGSPGLGLLLVMVWERSSHAYVMGLAIGSCTAALIALATATRYHLPEWPSWLTARNAFRISLPTLPHLASLPILLTATIALITARSGVDAAAQLQLAVMLGSSPLTVLNAINNAWAPMVMKASPANRPKLLERTTQLISAAMFCVVSVYVLLAPSLLRLIGGPVVQSDIPARASVVIAAATSCHLIYLANIHLTFISGRTWPLAITTPTSAALALAFCAIIGRLSPDVLVVLLYALVWPMFYLFQAGWSLLLRTGTGLPSAKAHKSALILFAIILLCAAVALNAPLLTVIVLWVATAAALGAQLIVRRVWEWDR